MHVCVALNANYTWFVFVSSDPDHFLLSSFSSAANKYMNTRLVEQVERRLREIAKRDAGKGVILRGSVAVEHLLKQVVACFSLGVTGWPACYEGKKKIHSGVIVGGFGDKAFCKFPGHFHTLLHGKRVKRVRHL